MNAIAITLHLHPKMRLTDDEYYEFCRLNPDINFEIDQAGRLLIVPPTGGWTGNKNIKLSQQLANWTDADGTGIAFDSNTEFVLPKGGKRAPDAAWIKLKFLFVDRKSRDLYLCDDYSANRQSPDYWHQ